MSPKLPSGTCLQTVAVSLAEGRRVGAFVVFADDEGVRHAVRLGAVLVLSDADACQDATVLQMPGGRALLIRASFEAVLTWFG